MIFILNVSPPTAQMASHYQAASGRCLLDEILTTVLLPPPLYFIFPYEGNRFNHDHGRLMIACTWAYALVFACSPLAHWGEYGPEPYGTACCIDWKSANTQPTARSYTVVLFLLCYILPCGIIVSSYTQILFTVRESRKAVERHISTQTHMSSIQTIIVKVSDSATAAGLPNPAPGERGSHSNCNKVLVIQQQE